MENWKGTRNVSIPHILRALENIFVEERDEKHSLCFYNWELNVCLGLYKA